VVKLMTIFCGMLWIPRGYVGVSGEKNEEEKIPDVIN